MTETGGTVERVKGHAWRGSEGNQFADKRFICECGARGSWLDSVRQAKDEHREHKQRSSRPIRSDEANPSVGNPTASGRGDDRG